MCRQPKEINATASKNAFRGEFVNKRSVEDTPEVTGEYWIPYRDTRRRNIAETVHTTPQTMVIAALNSHNLSRINGNLVSGGMIVAAQLSAI